MPVSTAERRRTIVKNWNDGLETAKENFDALDGRQKHLQGLLGNLYDASRAAKDRKEKRPLEAQVRTLGRLVSQGETLRERFGGAVNLPQIPDVLLDPKQADAIQEAKLEAFMIPGFSLGPKELDDIRDGRPSRFDDVFSRKYLQGVVSGEYQRPRTTPSVIFVDRLPVDDENKITPLANATGFRRLAHTPIEEAKSQVSIHGPEALQRLDLNNGQVQLLDVKEAAVLAMMTKQNGGAEKPIVADTRIQGTHDFLIFDPSSNERVRPTDGESNGMPPRLRVGPRRVERYVRPRTLVKAS